MKKIVAMLIAALVSVFLGVSVCAFVPQNIKSLRHDFASQLYDISLDGEPLDASNLTQITARPASELEIALVGSEAALFLDQKGDPINTADVTVSKMRAAGVAVNAETVSGGDFFDEIELSVKNAGTSASKPVIRLRFPAEYSSLEPMEFSANIWISFNGEAQTESQFTVAGIFGRLEIPVSADDVTVSADSAVLFAVESIPLITVDAGSGVSVEASMNAGGRYLAAASVSKDSDDLALITEQSGIVDVLRLDVTGFEPEQIISVIIEREQILQVYDEYGIFLGNTSQKLPYSEKYYLAEKKVNF